MFCGHPFSVRYSNHVHFLCRDFFPNFVFARPLPPPTNTRSFFFVSSVPPTRPSIPDRPATPHPTITDIYSPPSYITPINTTPHVKYCMHILSHPPPPPFLRPQSHIVISFRFDPRSFSFLPPLCNYSIVVDAVHLIHHHNLGPSSTACLFILDLRENVRHSLPSRSDVVELATVPDVTHSIHLQ